MFRRIFSVSILFALVMSVFLFPHHTVQAATTAANPTLIAEVNGSGKGRVWAGAIPAGSSSKPVLVFVHGLHGKAPNWWGATTYSGTNDMYARAYASGYRTAFVSLDDEVDGPASSMWANGATLNRQLDVILAYYGVSSVNIVAHSKGGVDTNSAVIHYGAASKVQRIVTLSSPHYGSQLADLAYSWWAGWLASLLGQRDDGTYTMQTSYMSYFRSETDSSANYNNVRFYTSGGTNHGPFFSAMWFGGAYLPGDNDGVVTVANSVHPKQAGRLFTANLNHDNIRKGSESWSRIEPTLRTTSFRADAGVFQDESLTQPSVVSANQILRGGQLGSRTTTLSLPLENAIHTAQFDLLASSDALKVTLVSPDGQRFSAQRQLQDTEFFSGAWHYGVEVDGPAAGSWTVELSGPEGSAYMLATSIVGGATVTYSAQSSVTPGGLLSTSVQAADARSLHTSVQLSGTPTGTEMASALPTQRTLTAQGTDRATVTSAAPRSVGIYQYGMTITGINADGFAFERSVPTNFAVLTGRESIDALPAGR